MRQIQSLRSAVIGFAVHAILVVAARTVLNAALGLHQQHRPRSEDHRTRRADAGASRLQAFFQPLAAQFAFGHARVITLPLEARNVIRTGDRAVTAANALVGGPADDARFRILVQRLERASRGTCGIETLHALAFGERELRTVL